MFMLIIYIYIDVFKIYSGIFKEKDFQDDFAEFIKYVDIYDPYNSN